MDADREGRKGRADAPSTRCVPDPTPPRPACGMRRKPLLSHDRTLLKKQFTKFLVTAEELANERDERPLQLCTPPGLHPSSFAPLQLCTPPSLPQNLTRELGSMSVPRGRSWDTAAVLLPIPRVLSVKVWGRFCQEPGSEGSVIALHHRSVVRP